MSVNGVGKKVNIKPLQQADSKDFKGGLRIDKFGEGVSEKDKAIFKAMDKNNDGVVTQDELTKFFAGNENSKGLDKNSNGIVTRREAKKFIKNNQTLSELQIDKKELLAFLSKAGQASENVKSCTINDQGQVVVTYNDGSTDTISPDASRINESTNSAGDKVTTTFAPNGKKSSEVVVGPYANQLDDCTTTTLYEADGETVKNITVTDSENRVISKTEGNTVTDIRYGEQGTVYESVSVDGKLTKTTVKDSANNKTTVIEYDTAVGEDGAQLPKTRTETTGDEVKTYTFENGVKSTLTIKKGTKTENYEYNEAGTEAKHVSTDVVKGNGIIEHQAFSEQNGKNVTTISIDGKNQSQSVFGANGKVARTIKYADAPNGERATVVVIQDQESIADICNKFGMTQEEFEAFNKGNKNGLNGNVGAEVNVKGELEVTDSRFDGRLSSKAAVKAKNNRIYREQLAEAKSIANQRQETVMLISRDKNYGGSWENVARDLYKQEGNTQYSKMDLKVRAQQLQKLNPEVKKFEYGRTVIRVAIDPASMESNDTVRKLSNGSDATMEWVMAKGGETHAWNIALRACQQTENDVARPLTPLQQGIRAKKIIELNPGVFDKTGKMINPPANGKLKIPAGYTQAYKKRQAEQKAKLENQYYVAAEQVYKSAVDKTGMSAVSTIKKQLNSVNSDHIVQFYESYNTYLQVSRSSEAGAWAKEHGVGYTTKGTFGNKWMRSDDSSIYDTICSETGMGTVAGKQQRKDLCNDIFGRIATAAQKAGVSQADINNARNRFTSSMNAEFNGSGTVNTTKMEQATDWLIGKIHEAKTGAGAIDTKTAQDAFKSQYAQSVNGAQESFDKNMENVTWVGTFTAWAGNIFADNTTVGQMENKLGLAKGSLDKLNKCKTQAEFNTTYEQIFGVPFNAKNVATVMKLEENLQTIAQNEAQVEGINKSFATISRSNSLSDYENWVTAGIKNPQEKAQTLEAIYSQFGGADDISKLSEAAKMNAIRKAKDAEIAAIQAETKQLKGGKTTEQIREDISTLASASFGPNNNIAKEVEKFNGNINRAEMVGTVVTEIGVTLIPVGRVLSLAGKGVRLANGAYKAYKTGKAVKTATTAVKATKAATTTAKTTEVAADVSNAAGGIKNRVKNVVSAALKDPITSQSAQAGFNSGVLDYSKYGDAEHAFEHGLETAAMFEIGGRASKFSQKLSSDLEISSAAGRWAVEAGVTGAADTAAAYVQTTIINGQDLSTEDGMMNFGLDAAFALLGARGSRVKPQGAKAPESSVLGKASNDGVTGGKFSESKFQKAREEAKNVTAEGAPDMYRQAGLHRATNRQQGRTLENDVLQKMGIRREGKKLIADTAEGKEVVRRVNQQLSDDASKILTSHHGGELNPHDSATLDAHLANNCNSKEEVQQFINNLKKRVGTDANGNLISYTAADGVDHGAFVLKNAERKLKTLGNFDDALKTIPAEGGMADLATVRAFMGRPEATSEQLQSLLSAMQANPSIKSSQGARKLMADLQGQIEIRKQASTKTIGGEGSVTVSGGKATGEGSVTVSGGKATGEGSVTVTGGKATGEGSVTVTGGKATGEGSVTVTGGTANGNLTGIKKVARNQINRVIKKVEGFFGKIFGGSGAYETSAAAKVKRGNVQQVKSHKVPAETNVQVSRKTGIEDSAFEVENYGGKSILVKDGNGKPNVVELGKGEKVVIGKDKHGNDLVAVRDADGDVKIHRTKDAASVEVPKFEGLSAEQRQTTQKALDDYAQKWNINKLDKNNPMRKDFENITAKLELIDDPVIANAVKERFESLTNQRTLSSVDLREVENLLDAVNSFNGHYSVYKYNSGYSGDFSNISKFNRYLRSVDLAKHPTHEIGTYNGHEVITKLNAQNNTVIEYQGANGPVQVVAKVNGKGLNVEYHDANGSVRVVPQKGRIIEIGDSGYKIKVLDDRKIEVKGAGNELNISREGEMIDSKNLEKAADGMNETKAKKVLADLPDESRIDMISRYIGMHKDSNMSGYLYENYYLKHLEKTGAVSRDTINACRKIKDEYGSHVFLSASDNAQDALEAIDKEFAKWKKAGGSEVNFPPQINFSKIRRNWYHKHINGTFHSAAHSMPGLNRSLEFSRQDKDIIESSLRHEMTHSNDLVRGNVPQNIVDNIMPKKTERRGGRDYQIPDMDKAKYVQEFRNAGIPEWLISYAYNNPKEFIAVASEGNLSKYSPEFRQVLMDFGMPKWLFNLDEPVVKL